MMKARVSRWIRCRLLGCTAVLVLFGCGGYSPPPTAWHCETVLGMIGSNHPVDCSVVAENAALAYGLMHPLPDFDRAAQGIESIVIRDERVWTVHIGDFDSPVSGSTYEYKFIEIGRDMYSLDHELGHRWMYVHFGDSDPNHHLWLSTGQGGSPFGSPCLSCEGRDGVYVAGHRDPSL